MCVKGYSVIVAKVGAVLPGLTIKATTVRGQPSFGMICSYSELGLDDKFIPESMKEGIAILSEDYPVGMDALEALGWDDTLFDISLNAKSCQCELTHCHGVGSKCHLKS
jgi:phenylalanyl-tRNA synthetase beta chain